MYILVYEQYLYINVITVKYKVIQITKMDELQI